jgi:MFS transporter, Spinster family, sphingosine-1-phosphate transporter
LFINFSTLTHLTALQLQAVPAPALPPGASRDARLSLALLLFINLFNYIDRQILSAVVPQIEKELLPTDPDAQTKIGLLTSAFMVSYMLASPVFGVLGDRMRRWTLVGVGVILWSLASGATGLATTYSILLFTRLFVGIGEAAYGPTAPTIIADLYPVSRRGGVLAWFYMAIPVGSALGYILGGQLAHHFGWRVPFYAVVLPGMFLGILCFFRREPRRGEVDPEAPVFTAAAIAVGPQVGVIPPPPSAPKRNLPGGRRRVSWADIKVLLLTPSYVLNTAGMTAMTFALGGMAVWMPKYVSDVRHAGDLGKVNTIFGAIVVVAGLIGTLAGGYLADALRKRWSGSYFLVSGVGLLIGFPCFIGTLLLPFPLAWGAMFVAVFCLMFNTGPTNTIIANVAHPSLRSTAYALNILVIHALGDVLSPPLIGFIADRTGSMDKAFMAVSAMFLIGGVFWLAGAKFLERDTRLASTRLPSDTASSPRS